MGAVVSIPRARTPGRPYTDGRQVFDLFPTGRGVERYWLYVVGFSNGRTKIGYSRQPRSRIKSYWSLSAGSIEWAHLSQPLAFKPFAAERRALEAAGAVANRLGDTEYFHNLGRVEAIACLRNAIAAEATA